MKKLLYLIPFITMISAYADTSTGGSLKLTKPSTGVYSTVPPGIKLNNNFQIIDDSFTRVLTNISVIANDTTTLNTNLNNYMNSANSTMTALTASTTSLKATAAGLTTVGLEEGTPLSGGQVSAINCVGSALTCTQSQSSMTITVAVAAASPQKGCAIYLGTTTTFGADVVATTIDGFNFAISSMGGNNISSSGTVCVQAGTYYTTESTITVPPGITFSFDKGAWIKNDQTKSWHTQFAVSGTLLNANLDLSTGLLPIAVEKYAPIRFLGGGRVLGGEMRVNMAFAGNNGTYNHLGFDFLTEARDAVLDGMNISSYSIGVNATGDNQTNLFTINGATRCVIRNINLLGSARATFVANRNMVDLRACDGFDFINSNLQISERFLSTELGSNGMIRGFKLANNRFTLSPTGADGNGTIFFQAPSNVYFSSGVRVENNDVSYKYVSANPFIVISGSGQNINGILISGNVVYHDSVSTGGGFTIQSGAITTIITNNQTWGTTAHVSDAGTNTHFTAATGGYNNYKNSVPQ